MILDNSMSIHNLPASVDHFLALLAAHDCIADRRTRSSLPRKRRRG